MFLVDSHCHLDRLNINNKYKNVFNFIKLCKKNNIRYILSVSVSIKNFLFIFSMFSYIDMIKLSCGIHPLFISYNDDYYNLEKFVSYKKVIAVGESGLDYKSKNINLDIKNKQINNFIYHLYLSEKYKKPCIVHTRNSFFDTINILKKFDISKFGCVIHCFSYDDKNILFKFLNLGLYISISGLVTFKNFISLQKIIKYLPLDRLLVETDSPYLSPEPYKNISNDPFKIIFIIKKISKLKKKSFYTILKNSTKNFLNLFKL